MSVYRRRIGGDSCPLGGLATLGNAATTPGSDPSGLAVDALRQLWWRIVNRDGAVAVVYGSYDRTGVLTVTGTSGTLASASVTDNAMSIAVDPALGTWLLASPVGNVLNYGTYDDAGLPTKSGQLALPDYSANSLGTVAIDTARHLWWTCGHRDNLVVYGSLDVSGVPTRTGALTADLAAVGVTQCVAVDPVRNLLWAMGNGLYVGTYDETGNVPTVADACGDTDAHRYAGVVDPVQSLLFAPNMTDALIDVYRYGAAGQLTLRGTVVGPRPFFAGDIRHRLLFATGWDAEMLSGRYC